MNGFVCVARFDGGPGAAALRPYARRLAACTAASLLGPAPLETLSDGPFAAAATARPGALRPLLARRGALVGAGDVRLDNRAEVAAWSGADPRGASDLELVLAAWEARGPGCVDGLLGDFGFAVWDARLRTLHAARDAFGVKPLYHAARAEALAVGSRLLALTEAHAYGDEYAADFLATGSTTTAATPFADALQLPAGHALACADGTARTRRFWRPQDVAPAAAPREDEAVEAFRACFFAAVRARLDGGGATWAQLSGGLDSSSIVCAAAALAGRGEAAPLGGTLSMLEGFPSGDERSFSETVARRCGVRNETAADYALWDDDGLAPPLQDEPRRHFPFWARDRRLAAAARALGGRVVLSGAGGDHYLTGDVHYVADLLAAGRFRRAVADTARFAVALRRSFWGLFWSEALAPLVPPAVRTAAGAGRRVPGFIRPDFSRRTGMAARLQWALPAAGPHGRFRATADRALEAVSAWIERGVWEDGVEMRYPFFHRPLVELALALPPEMVIRPGETRWILRRAMRGILPEEVRTRTWKSGPTERMDWSLVHRGARVAELLRDPLVAQAGWVDPGGLRRAVERVARGDREDRLAVHSALALETWMRVHSGRWTLEHGARTFAA